MDEHEIADAIREAIDAGAIAELASCTTDSSFGTAAGCVVTHPTGRFQLTIVQIGD